MSNIVKLKEGIEITNTEGNTVTFKIEYDPDDNSYYLNPTSYTRPDGSRVGSFSTGAVFYRDQWYQNQFDYFRIDADGKNRLQQELNTAAEAASRTYIAPKPKWATQQNNTSGDADTAVTNNNPPSPAQSDQSNSITELINVSLTALSDFTDLVGDIADGAGSLEELSNDSIYNKGSAFGSNTTLVYPLALGRHEMHKDMDTVVIKQFNYKAPNKEDFIKPKNNIFTNGLSGKDPTYRKEEIRGTVILPMPQSFEESRKVQYGEDTMNTLAAGMTQAVLNDMGTFAAGGAGGAVLGGLISLLPGGSGGSSSFGLGGIGGAARTGIAAAGLVKAAAGVKDSKDGKSLLSSVMSSNILKAAGVNVSAETILARGAGVVPNPNMELLFRSPLLRNFALAYRMTARSAAEAQVIRQILRFFKQGMSPRNSNETGNYFLKTPNVFQISFKTTGNINNPSLPKFKTCALRGFSVDYTPDKMWAAYDKGQPVSVTMVMEFGELTPIYSGDYEEDSELKNNTDFIGY